MASYRIVCTEQVPAHPHPYGKIVAVGTNAEGGAHATERLSVADVVGRMNDGHSFYTRGLQSDKIAAVVKYWCSACGGEWHIKSAPDAVKDNNLDELRVCAWKAA
jgi:hypothetical protein